MDDKRLVILRDRLASMKDAHARFNDSIDMMYEFGSSEDRFKRTMRNSALRSFDLTFDPFWKFLRAYLLEVQLVDINDPGPRAAYRKAEELRLITAEEHSLFMKMIEDRNQSAHDYDEFAIEEIKDKLPDYCKVIGNVLARMQIPEQRT